MAKLTHEIQAYIVQALARWRKPSLIVKDVKAEFGVALDRRQVAFYNPEAGGEKRLAKEWYELFDETRRAYVEGTVQIGIAHKSFRLSMLHRIAERAEEQGNLMLAMQAAEQAAKEQGNLYTNKREHSGPDGRPISFSVEDRQRELAGRILRKLVDRGRSREEARDTMINMGMEERHVNAALQDSRA